MCIIGSLIMVKMRIIMESQQVGDAPQNVQVHTNNIFLQYMQINADFMNGLYYYMNIKLT